jgi:hypothetical protein
MGLGGRHGGSGSGSACDPAPGAVTGAQRICGPPPTAGSPGLPAGPKLGARVFLTWAPNMNTPPWAPNTPLLPSGPDVRANELRVR